MPRSAAERIVDVRRLQRAARNVIEQRGALVDAIVESTGLSPEGVELGLTRHVEVDAGDLEIAMLVERAAELPRVAVVLSANVFVGALRAIAIAGAASYDVLVRPSRRDPAFARALVAEANRLGDTHLRIVDDLDIGSVEDGEIHVYGRDETIAEMRTRARPAVRLRGHGSGMGVALISADADLERAARGLADDVVVFDQRGCLSPRIALVLGDETRASALADALHAQLERLEVSVPRGAVPADERAAAGRYVATMTYAFRVLVGSAHAIGIAPPGAPLMLPPPYRTVHVAACASFEEAMRLLAPLARGVVAVGSDDPGSARRLAPSWARVAVLGMMQRPPLDGPVDLRDG
jgi:acyl-CoA reductase-like NAD-dependent aldehyde dehydrogenase